jgi:hypothetical protein
MGAVNCKSLATQYVISSDPYYKIHLLLTLVVYVLSYIYYLKDENFDDYENKFIVFLSKFVLLPIALNYIIAMGVGVVIGYMRGPLIELTVKQCGTKDPQYITNKDLRSYKIAATAELKAKLAAGSTAGSTTAPATPPTTPPTTPSS